MIQFTLKCEHGHTFDAWFKSSEDFDSQSARGLVTCAVCGSTHVQKALMAPRVQTSRTEKAPEHPLSKPASEQEEQLAALRRKVEESATYVGGDFAREARAMHDGDSPERPIYGEAKPDEARSLLEDGIPVLPLPFSTGRKTN